MGSRYVNQDAFSPAVVMGEASSSTPIFFILFPGYSPSKEIEAYAREVNHTVENGKLTLISMGQVRYSSLASSSCLAYRALVPSNAHPFESDCWFLCLHCTVTSNLLCGRADAP